MSKTINQQISQLLDQRALSLKTKNVYIDLKNESNLKLFSKLFPEGFLSKESTMVLRFRDGGGLSLEASKTVDKKYQQQKRTIGAWSHEGYEHETQLSYLNKDKVATHPDVKDRIVIAGNKLVSIDFNDGFDKEVKEAVLAACYRTAQSEKICSKDKNVVFPLRADREIPEQVIDLHAVREEAHERRAQEARQDKNMHELRVLFRLINLSVDEAITNFLRENLKNGTVIDSKFNKLVLDNAFKAALKYLKTLVDLEWSPAGQNEEKLVKAHVQRLMNSSSEIPELSLNNQNNLKIASALYYQSVKPKVVEKLKEVVAQRARESLVL